MQITLTIQSAAPSALEGRPIFIGSIPKELCAQLARVVPFGGWGSCFVCCSGSFRMEQTIHLAAPDLPLHSNDVSLYSTAIGRYATGQPFAVTFTDRLAFVEDVLAKRRRAGPAEDTVALRDRCAAVLVAHDMSRYAGKNDYARKHFAYFEQDFDTVLTLAAEKLAAQVENTPLASYFAGDLCAHIDHAITRRADGETAGVALFPPSYKKDYENRYKFLTENTAWEPPSYPLFDPASLPALIERIEDAGLPFCIVLDTLLPGRKPVVEFVQGRHHPHFAYAGAGRSSLRHLHPKPVPFRYTPIDAAKLHAFSAVQVVKAEAGHMSFLKDVYLSKAIVHSSGMWNYLVLLDGMLVGGLVYSLPQRGDDGHSLYLLSDVCASSEMRLSKLLSTIATSQALIRPIEKRLMKRVDTIATTAFTPRPVSMKYRGVFELVSRRPSGRPEEGNVLQYHSGVRAETPQQMYHAWFQAQAGPTPEKGRRRGRRSSAPEPGS